MTAALVGSPAVGGATSGTSFATSFGQAPTAGNTLILSVSVAKGSTGEAALTVTGWTLMGKAYVDSGAQSGGVYIFAKIAAGGDTAPSIGAAASVNLSWLMEEYSGLAASLISTGIPVTGDASTSASPSLSQSRTSASAGEFQYAAQGGRGATSNPAVTWGGGLSAEYNTSSGRISMLKSATGSIASSGGSMTGTATLSNAQGNPVTALVMAPFALAGGAPPPQNSAFLALL